MAPKSGFWSLLAMLYLFTVGVAALPEVYYDIRYAHASIASTMAVVVFPLGGIIIRTCSFKGVFWVHVFLQMLGYCMFCYVFAAGIYMSYTNNYYIDPHIVMGIILFGLCTLQPIIGTSHHVNYKKFQRRTFATSFHVIFGRTIVPLAIVNGGLGLWLSIGYPQGRVATKGQAQAYGIIGGIVWIAYVFIVSFAEARSFERADTKAKDYALGGVEERKLGVYEGSW